MISGIPNFRVDKEEQRRFPNLPISSKQGETLFLYDTRLKSIV